MKIKVRSIATSSTLRNKATSTKHLSKYFPVDFCGTKSTEVSTDRNNDFMLDTSIPLYLGIKIFMSFVITCLDNEFNFWLEIKRLLIFHIFNAFYFKQSKTKKFPVFIHISFEVWLHVESLIVDLKLYWTNLYPFTFLALKEHSSINNGLLR